MPSGNRSVGPRSHRSIVHDAPNRWVGWDRILELYRRAKALDKIRNTIDHSLYFVILFVTGGRISEVLDLKPQQIAWNDEAIRVDRMEVLKRRKRFTRTVYVKREGFPLTSPFINLVEACNTDYLCPGYGASFTRTLDPQRHASQAHVYRKITAIDPDIWSHWLRDQRSWHLSAPIDRGGRGFDPYLLKEWFGWASMEMPAYYSGRRSEREILEALHIKDF